jgi:hypothetical protein
VPKGVGQPFVQPLAAPGGLQPLDPLVKRDKYDLSKFNKNWLNDFRRAERYVVSGIIGRLRGHKATAYTRPGTTAHRRQAERRRLSGRRRRDVWGRRRQTVAQVVPQSADRDRGRAATSIAG